VASRLEQSITTALKLAAGLVTVAVVGGREHIFSEKLACPDCGISVAQLEPRSFSFNSPYGACPACNGLGSKYEFTPEKVIADWTRPLFDGGLGPGAVSPTLKRTLELAAYAHEFNLETALDKLPARVQNMVLYGYPPVSDKSAAESPGKAGRGAKNFRFKGVLQYLENNFAESGSDSYREWMTQYMAATRCTACHGKRLRPESLAVKLGGYSIANFTALSLQAGRAAVDKIIAGLSARHKEIAGRPLEEVAERLDFLLAVGLSYLSLDRSAATLSGGEAQRIRLATQIGSRLRGVLYVLDEPSIGLHARDNDRLLGSLEQLRNLGNTVLVVEHDEDTIRRADFVVDLGPGAGKAGANFVHGSLADGAVSQWSGAHCNSREAPQSKREVHPDPRGVRQQFARCGYHISAGIADGHYGSFRLRQIHAGERYLVPGSGAETLSRVRGSGDAPRNPGRRKYRQSDRD
jgi:excinuclease ABC subunit A